MLRRTMRKTILLILVLFLSATPHIAQQTYSPKDFEKLVKSSTEPLFVDGERVYRPAEVTQRAIVTLKPEPQFTEKARTKKTTGRVSLRVVFKSTGEVKILHVLKRLPNGLTEQASDAARRMKFEAALLDGTPVSQTILLDYNFNRY